MLLVDTSVWVDHLRHGDEALAAHLRQGSVAVHSGVIGELALGHLRNREQILTLLSDLPQVQQASDAEVLHLIQSRQLMGRGIGYVDAHLLASCLISATQLWTRDQRLLRVADDLRIAAHQ
jgi:hypothetical protein